MSLSQFLHFNHHCPLCNEPLHLYMQWIPSKEPVMTPFRAELVEPCVYRFRPISEYVTFNDSIRGRPSIGRPSTEDEQEGKLSVSMSDFVLLTEQHDDMYLHFSDKNFERFAKTFQVFFYFLCNPAGMKKKWQTDYEIDLYRACYYRSSPFFEMKSGDNWKLRPINEEHDKIANLHEAFALKEAAEDKEKVYMVNIDHENDRTRLWYYTVNEEQKKSDYFEANLFEKEMPLMKKAFNFENRQKLLDRLSSWVIMS